MSNTVDNVNDFSQKNKGKILAFNSLVAVVLIFFLANKLENNGTNKKHKRA